MDIRRTLRIWRQRYREHRLREREANRLARERVEQADRDVNLAGLKSRNAAGF